MEMIKLFMLDYIMMEKVLNRCIISLVSSVFLIKETSLSLEN